MRVAAGGGAQDRGGVAGGAVPVGVERFGARVEEDEAGVVRRPRGCGVQLGEQRASELVGGEDVEAVVAARSAAAPVIASSVHWISGRMRWLGLAPARARAGRLGGAGEVEEVGALGVVELERPGQRLQHALGGAAHVAALQARVVRDAHAGQHRDLFAAQSGDAASAVGRQPGLLGRDPARGGR